MAPRGVVNQKKNSEQEDKALSLYRFYECGFCGTRGCRALRKDDLPCKACRKPTIPGEIVYCSHMLCVKCEANLLAG